MSYSSQALTARLEAATGLTALVSTRIYPNTVPQNAQMPYVRTQKISHPRNSVFGVDISLGAARHQVDSVAATYAQARAVAAQVQAALQRYRGTSTGVVVQDIFLANELDSQWEPETGGHRVIQDYIIWHEE